MPGIERLISARGMILVFGLTFLRRMKREISQLSMKASSNVTS